MRRRAVAQGPGPEQALALLALVVALVGALVRPAALLLSPDFQVWDRAPLLAEDLERLESGFSTSGGLTFRCAPQSRDPWGAAWRLRRDGHRVSGRVVWSAGPDGVHDDGAGDDVRVDPAMRWYDAAPWVGVWAALGLLWLAAGLRCLRAPRGPAVGIELGRAAVAASIPAAIAGALVHDRALPDLLVAATPGVAPPEVAVVGLVALVSALVALAWRARRGAPRTDRPATPGRLVAGLALAGVALGASGLGRLERLQARADQRRLALALLGQTRAIRDLLRGDELAPLEALVATPPELSWKVLGPDLRGFSRLGPRANHVQVAALGELGPEEVAPLQHLIVHDPGLVELATAVRADLHEYARLVLDRPSLTAAFAGPRPCLELLLRDLRPDARLDPSAGCSLPPGTPRVGPRLLASVTELLGGLEPDADLERRRAWWSSDPALVDGWVVVTFAQAQVERPWTVRLHDASEVERVVSGEPDVVVLGPVPPTPAGRWLVAEGQLEVELPEIRPGGWVWVEVDPDRRRATARWIARPE